MTITQVKARFERQGLSIKEWAEERGFRPTAVYHVLNGMNKGRRGNAHRIAVELGLKQGAAA